MTAVGVAKIFKILKPMALNDSRHVLTCFSAASVACLGHDRKTSWHMSSSYGSVAMILHSRQI